jgi:hypothetical protein
MVIIVSLRKDPRKKLIYVVHGVRESMIWIRGWKGEMMRFPLSVRQVSFPALAFVAQMLSYFQDPCYPQVPPGECLTGDRASYSWVNFHRKSKPE